ncbi:MAG: ergothioneine biosynthesis protein EgtB [Spirochaetia bacterium]|nr:ergothioneine biosynthesis protein EgtB [Spirochaetia bacterium]
MYPIIESRESQAMLADRFAAVRRLSESIVESLETEDLTIQAMADVSPPKWHLGHTTWFFDEFVLAPFTRYEPFLSGSSQIFNSYYESVGSRVARVARGHLSRPTVREILEYRRRVTEGVLELLQKPIDANTESILTRIEIGIHHEQQHQELLYTDLKYNLFQNYNPPGYTTLKQTQGQVSSMNWQSISGGVVEIGARSGFAYDNECPAHRVFLEDFSLADRLVTNSEFLAFMEEGGYAKFQYWLSDGWDLVKKNEWDAPLYWIKKNGDWFEYTLGGFRPLELNAPVTHVSFHEANAFAAWSDARLPTEFEWEHASSMAGVIANFLDTGKLHPQIASGQGIRQMFGDVWEWTSSAYLPYPGFQPLAGALGEYNGKFMNDQRVLRGGSCVTSSSPFRSTYRHLFQGDKRWQFTGIRLAR